LSKRRAYKNQFFFYTWLSNIIKLKLDLQFKFKLIPHKWCYCSNSLSMLLINSEFNNRKLQTSAKNNLVQVNGKQTCPKMASKHVNIDKQSPLKLYLITKDGIIWWLELNMVCSLWTSLDLFLSTMSNIMSKCVDYECKNKKITFL
jgi:hypothetical protein